MINTIKDTERNHSGVYKITNSINDKIYVGSTKNMIYRYRSHLSSLSRGKSGCRILQSAVIKHGLINFEFSVLEICDNYTEREMYYINTLAPRYNIIVESIEKRIISDETKALMSEAAKQRYRDGGIVPYKDKKHSNETKSNISKNRKQYTVVATNIITGEIINFNSVKDAKEHYTFGLSSIYQCCLGMRNSINNIIFTYKTNSQ